MEKTSIAFDDIRAFVVNVQKFNALQFNAKTRLLTETFGETNGIKYSERHDKYGVWFLIDQFPKRDEVKFYEMVLNLT